MDTNLNEMKKANLLLLFLFLCFNFGFAQVKKNSQKDNPDRIEFEKDEDSYQYSTPCGNKGFLMHGPDNENGSKVWKFHKFSTDLKEIESFSFKIGNKMKYNSYVINKDKTHVYIFLHSKKKKSMIIDYNINTGVAIEHEFKFAKSSKHIQNFYVVNSIAYFQSIKNIFSLNLKEEEKAAKVIFRDKGGRVFYNMDMIGKEEAISITYFESGNKNKIFVSIFDGNGEESEPIVAIMEKGFYATSANVSKLPNGSLIISGGYSTNSKYIITEGMYALKYSDRTDFFNTFSFNDILGTEKKRVLGVKSKKDKVQTRDILTHQIKVINNEALLVSEIYETIYRTETTTTTDSKGHTSTSTKQVFVGHQFYEGIAIKFDSEGEYVSTKTFFMFKMYYPRQIAKQLKWIDSEKYFRLAMIDGNEVIIYNYHNEIVGFAFSSTSITSLSDEKVKFSQTDLTYWYDNYLMAYGFQKIKGNKKRKVYFMSRVKFQDYKIPEEYENK